MTEAASALKERAQELRREFDRSFASPILANNAATEDLLAIRLGAANFALRLSEIAGLFVDKKITLVPGANAALVGVAGFRGTIIPVYDLQQLIGHSAGQTLRWLFLAAAAKVAFAFETFEGQLRVPAEAIKPHETEARQGFTKHFVQADGALRPIIELSSVVDEIKK